MTRDEIKNTPEIVDFMLDESVTADSRMKLRKRLEELCKLALKALEQEPRKGYWIENAPEYQNIDPPYICSECGNMHLRKTNYCDQCGAKMEEVEE